MKLVAKYTLALVSTLVVVLSILGYVRLAFTREEIQADLEHDHRTVGRVLQLGVADVWTSTRDEPAAARETTSLIRKANVAIGAELFAWREGGGATELETQDVEGKDFVSTFPIRARGRTVGTIVERESLAEIERHMRKQWWFTWLGIALIVVLGAIASVVLGAWLVRRPIALLVAQARRIGRGQLSSEIAFHARDELGELAVEMSAASAQLGGALAAQARATEARLEAVEQMRHADRLSTVGKLAAGIAHELGTPLSIVGGHAQMIAGGEVTGEEALASARAIDAEATRMAKIVRQLLDFARRKGPEGTTCDPSLVVARSVALLGVMIDRAKVVTQIATPTPAPRVVIDEDSLQQLVTNLVVNAIHAMPAGGTLAITTTRVASGHVRIAVSDTGDGIAADVRDQIFEPFFTTKEVGEGTGLGLAVVHGIITDHQGWITVETGAHGTTFAMHLREATP